MNRTTTCLVISLLLMASLLLPAAAPAATNFAVLDIFYSNDVSGQTEPCG